MADHLNYPIEDQLRDHAITNEVAEISKQVEVDIKAIAAEICLSLISEINVTKGHLTHTALTLAAKRIQAI